MLTDRALRGYFSALVNMPAVKAYPFGRLLADIHSAVFDKLGKASEAVAVYLFDLRNHPEGIGDGGKALLLSDSGKFRVDELKLLVLVVPGAFKQILQFIEIVNGVARVVDNDSTAVFRFKMIVENLGMLLFALSAAKV